MPKNKGQAETETAEVGVIEAAADQFAPVANVLRGDCRDAMLNVIRGAVDWGKYSEAQQHDVNTAVDYAAEQIVRKAVQAVAAEGRDVVTLKLEQVAVKDGLKIVCSGGYTHDALVLLGEAQGKAVQLTVADASAFDGQRGPAPVEPDQKELPVDGADSTDLADAGDAVAAEIEGQREADAAAFAEAAAGDGEQLVTAA
jgi:hypothetical protein